MKQWHEFENNNHYYFDDIDGMVIGQVHRFCTSVSVYTATVKRNNLDQILGQFVNMQYAKNAVQTFWDVESRTFIG
jgi:hypothetical protein